MKNKISILIVSLCLMLVGCSSAEKVKNDDTILNIKNKDDILTITGINVPEYFPKLINSKDFDDIEYGVSTSGNIEIMFNEEIVDKDYTLAYLQYANYYGIKSEYDKNKHINFKYSIDKNKLIITPKEGYPESGVISIYVPNSLESFTGKTIGSDKMFIFAANKLNDDNLYTFENQNIKRDTKSIVQVKRFNDGKKIAFINKDTLLFNDKDAKLSNIMLERGETVAILDDSSQHYKVEVYFPENYTDEKFKNGTIFAKKEKFSTVTGYVNKDDVIELSEPMNKEVYYVVMPIIDESNANVHLMIVEPLNEMSEIVVWDIAKKIVKEDLYSAEAAALNRWSSSYLFGGNYSTVYVDEKGSFDYPVDYVERHMPQYQWSQEDYNTYTKAYDMYCNYLLNMLDKYIYPSEISDLKTNLKEHIMNNILLEKTWINWGYENKLKDKDYFFKTIKEKSTESLKEKIIEQDFAYNNREEFSEQANSIINTMHKLYGQDNKIYKQMSIIQGKYMLKLITGEIDQVDYEKGKFNVIDDYLKESYTIQIDDYAKNNLKLIKGEKVSIACYYDFAKEIFYIDKIAP